MKAWLADMTAYKKEYLLRMTDDTGMLQHAKYSVPDPSYGYTTDDNARALILAAGLAARYPDSVYDKLLYRYAGFLLGAQKDDGRFCNFMGYDRRWLECDGSDDCQGKSIWGIASALVSDAVSSNLKKMLGFMLFRALPAVRELHFIKSRAYALLGLARLLRQGKSAAVQDGWVSEHPRQSEKADWMMIEDTAGVLSTALQQAWQQEHTLEWSWFEASLTYSNAMVPWSLLAYGQAAGQQGLLRIGMEALDFLAGKTMRSDCFCPVGCQGWWPRGSAAGALYDQQPLEAAEMLGASREAYLLTRQKKYQRWAERAYRWYEGRNIADHSLLDPVSGGCYDGITPQGVNENQGAESQIAWGISFLIWQDFLADAV